MNAPSDAPKPNIILAMCDDLGWGDTGFNGNEIIKTPGLDRIASDATVFTRFYAGGPVCSPTRGTCLTGRHYSRYGVTHANRGRLPVQEHSLGRVLKDTGYVTGHFGKWHLGTLTREIPDSNRGGPDSVDHYSPPWMHGFDRCFSTEARVPTWNPMENPDAPGAPFGTYYWNEDGERVEDDLDGCDSRVILDRAEPFIREAVADGTPFFAVVWFHAPHTPVVAGPEHRALYEEYSENEQHYYGCVSAMDEQMARLDALLDELGVADDTMLWFCSDNGPEGRDGGAATRNCGSTGGLRGRKRSLFNGGVGVPALVRYPRLLEGGRRIETPCSTLDYFPTITARLGWSMPDDRPVDGVDIMPLLRGETNERNAPIPYRFVEPRENMFGSPTMALTGDRFKFLTNCSDDGSEEMLFDIMDDPCERENIIDGHRDTAEEMRETIRAFMASFRESHFGADYPDDERYTPVNSFQEIWQGWCGG